MILLLKHQKWMMEHLKNVPHPALYASMRLGKAIVAIKHIDQSPDLKKILIIGPLSVLDSWAFSVEKVANDKLLDVIGSKKRKQDQLDQYDNFKYIFANKQVYLSVPEISKLQWDCVIFDESVGLKTPEALTKKKKPNITKYFCNQFQNVKKRIILSGYPAPNMELDYYQQLKFLHPELVLPFKSFYQFRSSCFKEIYPHKYVITRKGRQWLEKRLKECAYFIDYKKANFKHTLTEYILNIPIDTKLVKIKDILLDKYEIGEKLLKTDLQVYHYMRLLSSGIVDEKAISSYRVTELTNFVKANCANEKVLILVNFHAELKFLCEKLKINSYISGRTKPEKRSEVLDKFKESDERYLVCTVASMAYGANLSFLDTCIFFSLPNNSDHFEQVKLRIISQTNNKGLLVYLICKEMNDHKMLESLNKHKTRYEVIKNAI